MTTNQPEQVVVDRDALTALLQLADAEVETLTAAVKDCPHPSRRTDISDAHDTIAAVKKQIADQRRGTAALRYPYYKAVDGVAVLQQALNAKELQDDAGLLAAITKLTEALDNVKAYMDERYLWDWFMWYA